jgi:hypothetical protein
MCVLIRVSPFSYYSMCVLIQETHDTRAHVTFATLRVPRYSAATTASALVRPLAAKLLI